MKFRSRTRRLRAVSSPFTDPPDCCPEPTWPDKEYRLTTELSAEASASASAERPGLSVVKSDVESPGQPTSMPELIERIDILKEDCEFLRRENLRLHSELNQAIAQRDIARRQRDDVRARNSGMAP